MPEKIMPENVKPTIEELEAFRGLLLRICRTGTFAEVNKSQLTRVAHSGGKPIWLTWWPSINDEEQEDHPAKGRFQKVACIIVDLGPKARPKPDSSRTLYLVG